MLNEKEHVGEKRGFEGKWLTENYGKWRHVIISAKNANTLEIDMGEGRTPASGTFDGDQATVDFSDDATFEASLVEDGGIIQWSNGTEWVRKEYYERMSKKLADQILAMDSFYDDRIDAGEKLRRLGPEKAIEVLARFLKNKNKKNRQIAVETLYDAIAMIGEDEDGLKPVIDSFKNLLDDDDLEVREASARYLVNIFNERMAESLWDGVFQPLTRKDGWGGEDRGAKLLTISLAILNGKNRNDRRKSALWLKENLRDVAPREDLEKVWETLVEKIQLEDNFDVREQLKETLKEVEKLRKVIDEATRIVRESYRDELRDWKDESNHDNINKTIQRLLADGKIWSLRLLIQEWVRWIASGDPITGLLVESASNKMRRVPEVVELLVNRLDQEFKPDEELLTGEGSKVLKTSEDGEENKIPSILEDNANIESSVRKELKSILDVNLINKIVKRMEDSKEGKIPSQRFNAHHSTGLNVGGAYKRSTFGMKIPKTDSEIIRSFIDDEVEAMQLTVHRRIARQLAEMSNPDLFEYEDNESDKKSEDRKKKNTQEKNEGQNKKTKHKEICEKIQNEMRKHAVPVLANRLPEEPDPEIREHLAKVLGNVGGRESVDGLARAVVGEERTRARRQELLARYYLDPSKERSKQAEKILEDAVREAKKTLWLLQGLNAVVFFVGIIVLLGGLYVSFTQDGQRVAGALVGLGGLAGVVTLLINDPLNRIQNAMANLVQLETAFTSFIWELNLNGTYIQSQYVAEGVLTDRDVAQTVKRIEDAMNLTMNQVAIYTEEGRKLLVPHLTHLSTSLQKYERFISVYGKYLDKGSLGKKNATDHIHIHVNHQPVQVEKLSRENDELKFMLPSELPAGFGNGEPIWISLSIGGVETNALPLHL